jgi:hypothetical protein
MNKTLKSIGNSLKDVSYSIKSLGKSHRVKTLAHLHKMSVDEIDQMDPSDVSKRLLDATLENSKSLGAEKTSALKRLSYLKEIMPKRNSRSQKKIAQRTRDLAIHRKSKPGRDAANNKAVNTLLAMAKDQHALDEYDKMPSLINMPSLSSRKGGTRTRRRRRRRNNSYSI